MSDKQENEPKTAQEILDDFKLVLEELNLFLSFRGHLGMTLIGHCKDCKWFKSFCPELDINKYTGTCQCEKSFTYHNIMNPTDGCIHWSKKE